MSEMAKQAREAMKAKASRLTTADPHQKVDSSTWTPPEPLNTEVKTGLRPLSRRAFKSGGKVQGAKSKVNLGKATRGGNKPITPDNFANKDVKAANQDRMGLKHVGGLKTGGRAKKNEGGSTDEIGEMIKKDAASPQEKMPLPVPRPKSLDKPERFKSKYDLTTQSEKRGGKIEKCWGGKAKKAAGGPLAGAQAMMKKAQQTAGVPASTLDSVPATSRLSRAAGLKKGGTAKHDDVKQDMALIKKMVKPAAMRKGRDSGGRLSESTQAAQASRKAYDAIKNASDFAKERSQRDMSTPFTALSGRRTMSDYDQTLARGRMRDAGMELGRAQDVAAQTGYNELSGMPGFEADAERVANAPMKRGGKTKRAARKEGGGVFTGPGYPGKVPGVTGGRIPRATGGKTKGKGKTNINIVIAAGKPAGGPDMMNPMGGPTRPPGMDDGMGGVAPVPVSQAGGPPMPMPMPMPAPGGAPAALPPGMPPIGRKSGGRLTKVASSYKDMEAGSGGGEGRLQKTDIAKKHKDAPAFKKGGKVYRSYKDMDAGSGSGLGRLEKTEIQSHKR